MKTIHFPEGKNPVKLWLDDISEGTIQQIINLTNHPYTFNHVAIMPDCHEGYGMPIGAVLATKDVIIPNAVGVDIGCGMCAVQTSLKQIKEKDLITWVEGIKEVIPRGHKHHKQAREEQFMPFYRLMQKKNRDFGRKYPIVTEEYGNALFQLGTLGGGNHFIEIQKDMNGFIWVMVHSGSRNIGKKIADHYNRLAIKKNEEEYEKKIPKSWQLAYLRIKSEEGRTYVNEMNYCIEFAFANRKLMMDRILNLSREIFGNHISFAPMINIAHNFADIEKHFGEDVIVHRKGATRARYGETGMIPGSQGTASYIVRGKGNMESYMSCSHGAGRKMGRREAQRKLDLKKEKEKLNKLGILHAIRSERDLDEAPGAYKNIEEVMKYQEDLVEILVQLHPLAVIKG